MRNLKGKTAFVSGGANGFGLTLAAALLREGMNVAIGDLNADRVAEAVEGLESLGAVAGYVCDVTSAESFARCADQVVARFGSVHLVCNNAGVLAPNGFAQVEPNDWRWSFDVNVIGVVQGIATFLPILRRQGEGGWFLTTASMAGFRGLAGGGPYCASKAAAISASESLAAELADEDIGVTILCPGFMRTKLYESSLNRPDTFGGSKSALVDASHGDPNALPAAIDAGVSPEHVARRAIAGIRNGDLYVVTHPALRAGVAEKSAQLLAAYDVAEQEAYDAMPA